MSSLDDKLKAIILSGFTEHSTDEQITKEIAEVKQVFTDAGWIDTKKPITGPIHGVGVYETFKADFSHGKKETN